jgi:hypothetical protein
MANGGSELARMRNVFQSLQILGDNRSSTNSNYNMSCSSRDQTSMLISGSDSEAGDLSTLALLSYSHALNLHAISHLSFPLKMACTPPQVILILNSRGQESTQVDKLIQAAFHKKIVEESEFGSGITRSSQVFQE